MKEKMLMLGKVLLISFAFDIIDVFHFPVTKFIDIYKQYEIIKCLIFLNLTNIDIDQFCMFLFATWQQVK